MDSDSDRELSPEIQVKSRKVIHQSHRQGDFSHTFQLNEETPPSPNSEPELKFCRASHVKNVLKTEDVLCCVLSTFTLDLPYMLLELPELLSASATVYCMILFGKNASTSRTNYDLSSKLSSRLQLVEVSPRYQRTAHMGLSQQAVHIMGVHHPKYLLLFTMRGVHVTVTTSNLTPSQNSLDMSWTQFFPVQPPSLSAPPIPLGNDFGEVLEDFLQQVGSTTRPPH